MKKVLPVVGAVFAFFIWEATTFVEKLNSAIRSIGTQQ